MLAVDGLSKSYGATKALTDVSFRAANGEVFAILGENGAGKSTLLKILAGSTRPDRGSITLDNQPLTLHSPRSALRQGLVLVPQELAYVPDLSIGENILLGSYAAKHRFLVSQSEMNRKAAQFADEVGLDRRLDTRMRGLSLAEAQLVEIAKSLARNAKVLLLDEPTAALSQAETRRLFTTIDSLRARSIAILYISHRLDEVMEHGDKIMVLRDGRVTMQDEPRSLTKQLLIEGMLGRSSTSLPARAHSAPAGSTAMTVHNVSHSDSRGLRNVSVDFRPGEIVGLFGVRGAGQAALAETLVGLKPPASGSMTVASTEVAPFKNVRQSRSAGIVYIPPDRSKSLVLCLSVAENISLPQLSTVSSKGLLRFSIERKLLASAASTLRLRFRNGRQIINELSGGNQQKILVSSRLTTKPALLVAHEPTRGVDVGARREIHVLLRELAESGVAVVLATTDVEEAVDVSDRLIVMRDGAVVGELSRDSKSQSEALLVATGGPL